MSTGLILGVIGAILLIGWLLIDLLLWILGLQTFSQWLIQKATESRTFAIIALLVIVGTAAILIWHFELINILLGWFQ